jgi:hypothetical protein
MRPIFALPLFGFAFALGFNSFGAFLMVKSRLASAQAAATTEPVSTTTIAAATIQGPSVADVEAKAPKNADRALRFELSRTKLRHDGLTATFVSPIGWKPSHEAFPTKLAPVGKKMGEEGWLTHVDVGTSCDGVCAPKDWAPIIAKNAKDAVPDNATTREERLPDGRLVRWASTEDKAYVYAAWFVPGESRYYSCSAWLHEKALVPYLDAFVEICKTAKIER